jgi:hypothetical protein
LLASRVGMALADILQNKDITLMMLINSSEQ